MWVTIKSTIKRWLRSKHQRTYEWQFSLHYWKAVERWRWIKFVFGTRLFGMRGWTRTQRESFSILVEIFKTIFWQVIFAIALVSVLAVISYFLTPYIVASKFLPSLNYETSTDFLGIVAQVAGVFLALYFTAVSVVASTVYARVPGEIRELLTRERVGNLYIRIVALTVAVAALLLVKGALGFSIGILDVVFTGLLTVIAVFSFVSLGMRTFYFFDPTRLAEHLGYDLVRWLKAATPKGFQWHNSSFQAYYQKQAEQVLLTYRNVVTMAVNDSHFDGKALSQLILRPLMLLKLYTEKKASIPSESYWFKRKYQHRDWLTADYNEISLALRSGTTLHPELVPDFPWFERYIEEMVVAVIEALIQRNDLRNAATILDNLQSTQSALAEHLAMDESLHLFRELWPQVQKVAFGDEPNADSAAKDGEEDRLSKLGIIDVYCLGFISIMLGLSKKLRETDSGSFAKHIRRIRWHKLESIYTALFPRDVIKQLEYLQKRLEFEYAVEGKLISPLWYRNQIAALGMGLFIERTVEDLVKECEIVFGSHTERLTSEKRYLNATQFIQRGLEACDKFIHHLDIIKACFDHFSEFHRVQDIPWPSPAWEDFTKRMLAVRERLISYLAVASISLAKMPSKQDLPDYFGQCFSVLAEECISAMTAANEKLFRLIFPAFFNAALAAHERLRSQLGGRTDQAAMIFMTEPIEDLLHISGYALVYTELDGNKYWDIVKELWDRYLDNNKTAKEVVEFIINTVSYRKSVFAIPPRAPLRTDWQRKLEKRLRENKILNDISDYAFIDYRHVKPKHPSKIIQIIARGTMGIIHRDGQDVFLALYLAKRPEASGLSLPHSAKDFLDSLDRLRDNDDSGEGDVV